VKIHSVANPPPGLTSLELVVEKVEVTERGIAQVRLRVFNTATTVTVPVEFATLAELPAPGDPVNISLWRVP
jgi:hypothetical protein